MQLSGISSMATKALLAQLCTMTRERMGFEVAIESVGGVDAAKRVQGGEQFDVVVLASEALAKLASGGHVIANSTTDLVCSDVSMAIAQGKPQVKIQSEEDLKAFVLAQNRLSYSTGPSGVALAKLFERWGLHEVLAPRIVTPPPGIAVAGLVAKGEVDLGFQQTSEMLNVPGIAILGSLPREVAITTTFSAAVGVHSQHVNDVREILQFWASPACDASVHAQGMRSARQSD